jgi:hypothetical protein
MVYYKTEIPIEIGSNRCLRAKGLDAIAAT